ncbi:TPA: acidic protein MsyB, partial [Escherichia coli]
MNVNYLNDSDLDFLQHCSEEQLANFARLLTHNEKGKTRLSSVLMHNELFKSMEGHPEQHRRNWQLIAGELQHFGGDSIANKLRGHGKLYRAILLDVSKRLKLKADKEMSTFEIEQQLLEQFLRNTWKNMDEEHKQEFLHAVDARVNELEELLPLLMKDKLLAKGVSHLLSSQLTRILRTHAAMSVLG